MGWLDSHGGDGYDMLTPEQQKLYDEITTENLGGLFEDEVDEN